MRSSNRKRVFKYLLSEQVGREFVIDIPNGSDILDIKMQDQHPMMWVLVPEDLGRWGSRVRSFIWFWTGESFDSDDLTYVGTLHVDGMVYHLFEIDEEDSQQ